ncbi:histidine phosphatase family protein [Streptomyces flavofungini]|uniref:histidine phosphatase family protein n=1 Tax=Streptomyces flavofungini TaxID=68200 RepID=UPI0025AFCB03|nr:histidine phosphatase family protein [Streptomyces flavofungini]WJV44866.1 histidine phosphatase family protein [Streptomyces flavofungini]
MRSIYVIAHPEATHHIEKVVGGWHDSDLTPAGLSAAGDIARALRADISEGADVEVVTSDLRRAARTADAVGELFGVQPILDRRLREKSYGEAEGGPQEWLDRRFVPPPAEGDRMGHREGLPGAESRGECARRVYDAMDELLRRPREYQIVVTHGFALTFVVAAWIKMPYESVGSVSFRAPSGSITVLREDDFFHNRQVVRVGDTRHLAAP